MVMGKIAEKVKATVADAKDKVKGSGEANVRKTIEKSNWENDIF
jgi:hypothetical protein